LIGFTAQRLMEPEVEGRTDVVRIFPIEEPFYRLAGAILLEQNDEWAVRRARYISLESFATLGQDTNVSLPMLAD
jgi:putative transposase